MEISPSLILESPYKPQQNSLLSACFHPSEGQQKNGLSLKPQSAKIVRENLGLKVGRFNHMGKMLRFKTYAILINKKCHITLYIYIL